MYTADRSVRGTRRGRSKAIAAAILGLLVLSTVLVTAPTAGAVQPAGHGNRVVSATSPVSWTPNVQDGYVRTFAEVGNLVLSGGSFTTVRQAGTTTDVARANIVAFEKGTGTITPFDPGINGEVFSIVPTGDGRTVIVAGSFSAVGGQTVRSLVKLDVFTGQRVTQFNPPAFDGQIRDAFLRNGKVIVTGRFLNVASQPQPLLAAVDATTGALDPNVKATFADPRSGGALNIYKADVTPDGSKLVATGNFTTVNGLGRYQIAILDLTTSPATVADWQTTRYGNGCSSSFQSYMRGIDISPDGSYFVVTTTGAYAAPGGILCDTAARWNTGRTGTGIQPEWVNYTGGDTPTAAAIAENVVYIGGHQNYFNNPYIGDAVAAGAVPRNGLAAMDPRSGALLSWNPGKTRGWGVYGFLATPSGLYVGSDTDYIAGAGSATTGQLRAKQALLPLAGGTTLPVENTGSLPGTVYSLGLLQGGSGTQLDRVSSRPFNVNGPTGAQTISAGTSQWQNLRGSFMVDGKLYTGWSDKTFKVQDFDGTTFGPQSTISLQLDPLAASLSRFSTQDLATITGMFYDRSSGRIYFTKSGVNALNYRSFSPESRIVGAERFASATGAGGVDWTKVQSMFLAGGYLYTADSAGNLTRRAWDATAGLPTGSGTVVSGPAKGDGQDWRARDAFLYASNPGAITNKAPTAAFTPSCTGQVCSFNGSASSDTDGTIASYAWDFGDGSAPGVGVTADHTYAPGTYTVTLTVTDDQGATATSQLPVTITALNVAPTASFTKSCTGLTCTFDGSGSSDPDGTITSYAWDFGDGTTATGATPTKTYAAGTYTVSLTVTDNSNATGATTQQVTVTAPPAASVTFRGANGTDLTSPSTSVTVPTNVAAGDQLILIATINSADAVITGPAGWTLLDSVASATNTMQSLVWTRTATASDKGTTAKVTSSLSQKTSLEVLAYSGAQGISAWNKAVETGIQTTHTTPVVPVTTAGSTLVSYWADKSTDSTGWTLPASAAQRVQTVGTLSGHITAAAGDSGSLAPGSTGGITATAGGVANKRVMMWSIVIAPLP